MTCSLKQSQQCVWQHFKVGGEECTYVCERAQAAQDDQASDEGHDPADGDGGARHGGAAGWGREAGSW